MFKWTLLSIFIAATATSAQTLTFVRPLSEEFVHLGSVTPIELTIERITPPAGGSPRDATPPLQKLQLSVCQEVTGKPPCSTPTSLYNGTFQSPNEIYNVTIPITQAPGLSRIVATPFAEDGCAKNSSFVFVYLGAR